MHMGQMELTPDDRQSWDGWLGKVLLHCKYCERWCQNVSLHCRLTVVPKFGLYIFCGCFCVLMMAH